MIDTIGGGCRCRLIRYHVRVPQLPRVYACHCRDCQTWSGSAFSLQFIVVEDRFVLVGKPEIFELTSLESERVSRQYACPVCFTRLYNTNTGRPGMVVIRAGTLDHSDDLHILAHIWVQRKLQGIEIPDGVAKWPQSAPLADLVAVL